jgi:Transposase domain (DUF772)
LDPTKYCRLPECGDQMLNSGDGDASHPARSRGTCSAPASARSSHPPVRRAGLIDWSEFEDRFGPLYHPHVGRPGIPIRLMVGLSYLRHTFCLSDEEVVARWVENPYGPYLCGFDDLQLGLSSDPSSLVRWRQRIGEDGSELVRQETPRDHRRGPAERGGPTAKPRAGQRRHHRVSGDTAVFVAGQRRGSTPTIRRELRRRSARGDDRPQEARRQARAHPPKGALGDAIPALLCGAGHNLRRIRRHRARLLCALLRLLAADPRAALAAFHPA